MLGRRRFRWAVGVVIALVAGASATVASPAEAAGSQVTDLGTLPGGCCAQAVALNDRFVVVGTAYVGAPGSAQHAFRHDARGMIDLGTLPGGDSSRAKDVNNFGDVVGSSTIDHADTFHATLWRQGQVIDLGTLGGPASTANAINDHGQIVGWAETASRETHAFLWQRGVMTDLGAGSANGINERGDIVGTAVPFDNHAVIWRHGVMTFLPMPANAQFSGAGDINERGQVLAGYFASSQSHSVLIDGDRLTELGVPPGDTSFSGFHLNDNGEIVGSGLLTRNAWLWRAAEFFPLPLLSPNFDAIAGDIDNRGHAVGMAGVPNPTTLEDHAVMWTIPPAGTTLPS
jgi:probable HAF family extracellular repeat protein